MRVEYQTRSEETGLALHNCFAAALQHAEKDSTVWKISFQAVGGERVRLVRRPSFFAPTVTFWVYEPIVDSDRVKTPNN